MANATEKPTKKPGWRTPPQLAREYGVAPEKIIGLILAGELDAVNLATKPDGKRRYRISAAAIEAFEARRAVVPPAPRRHPYRRRAVTGPVEFS